MSHASHMVALLDAVQKIDNLPERLTKAIEAARDPEGTDVGSGGVLRFGQNGVFFTWPRTAKILRFTFPADADASLEWTKYEGVHEVETGSLADLADVAFLFEWLIGS